jgi:hypothetical protein
MTLNKPCLASLALVFWAAATPSMAASSAASSASDSITTSVGSVSGSIEKSSNSSSKNDKVADGDYRIIEVAAVAERPGMARMKLQALDNPSAEGEFSLVLPQEVVEQSRLSQGSIVTAHQRTYGLEFSQTAAAQDATPARPQAFFLVLSDDWYRELQTNAVSL